MFFVLKRVFLFLFIKNKKPRFLKFKWCGCPANPGKEMVALNIMT
jgi:hypothetical protein